MFGGAGDDSLASSGGAGITMVGGLIFSQLVTLYLTPVFYTYMASAQERFGRKKKTESLTPELAHASGD